MSILIGVGIVTTVTTFYLGRRCWHALHKAVGIRPGVLTYQNDSAPLSLSMLSWQQLSLNKKHLKSLPDHQLRQLQCIDKKVSSYHSYQQSLHTQNKMPTVTEQQFLLNKMLQTRLPDMLASYYHLAILSTDTDTDTDTDDKNNDKKRKADALLQKMLDNIEQRLDGLLADIERQNLQDLQAMDRYIDSHDS